MFETRTSYGKRVGNSFVGLLIGIILVPASLFVLGWNERDAVLQTGAITEIDRVAIADVDATRVNDQNEAKLVHIASEASTNDEVEFPAFFVKENAIRLRWDTSIYQWEEER